MRINLFTTNYIDGQPQLGAFVAIVEILPYQIMPEIVIWGSRYFVHVIDNKYREALMTVSVTESPGLSEE